MGNESSTSGSKTKGIPGLAKKNIIARWQNRQLSHQIFAVARHDERADGLCAIYNGGRWTQTEDFRKWPCDPPLSDAGIEGARDKAQRVLSIAKSTDCQISIVISSPYYRCVQTAVEYCLALGQNGQKTRLLIDRSLGEIYGPEIMGTTEPSYPVRPIEHTRLYCKSRGVTCHPKVIGKWPSWPEEVKGARKRYANRFLTYLQRGSVTKRNFILVTHADCVATSLSLMPSQAEDAVETVEYGGLFVATRKQKQAKPRKVRKTSKRLSTKSFATVVPGGDADGDSATDADESVVVDSFVTESPKLKQDNGWSEISSTKNHDGDGNTSSTDGPLELPQASDGWQVCVENISLAKKVFTAGAFNKRVKTLAKNGCFGRERIEKLLGELSEKPHGAGELEVVQQDARIGTHQSLPSTISFSTFLFGSSDVANMSDCGSDVMGSRVPTRADSLDDCLELVVRSPTQKSSILRGSQRSLSKGSHLSRWSNSSLGSPRVINPRSESFRNFPDEIVAAASKTSQSVLSPKQLKDNAWDSIDKQARNELWPPWASATVENGRELKLPARTVNRANRQADVGTSRWKSSDGSRQMENTLEIVDEKTESAGGNVPRVTRSRTIPMPLVQPVDAAEKGKTAPIVVKSNEDATPSAKPMKMPDLGNSALLRRRQMRLKSSPCASKALPSEAVQEKREGETKPPAEQLLTEAVQSVQAAVTSRSFCPLSGSGLDEHATKVIG